MVKQLDFQMIRKPEDYLTAEMLQEEDSLFLPTPTFDCIEIPPTEIEPDTIPSLKSLCVHLVSESLSLDTCINALVMADNMHIEELKINCLKFLSLNAVSFLEPFLFAQLSEMPVYLIRDLQNFVKTEQVEKFAAFNMNVIE